MDVFVHFEKSTTTPTFMTQFFAGVLHLNLQELLSRTREAESSS